MEALLNYVGAVTAVSLAGVASAQCNTAYAGRLFPTSDYPWVTLATDLDEDGEIDIIVAGSSVQVFLGNGDATFKEQQLYELSDRPSDLALADLNGDGQQDLLASTEKLAVLLGDGAGGFAVPSYLDVSGSPEALTAHDFDGDGDADVALVIGDLGEVTVLLNDGVGGLIPGSSYEVGIAPSAICSGDFNDDGLLDLAVNDEWADRLTILFGQGGGEFAVASTLATAELPHDVEAGDLDGDGDDDLVTTCVADDDASRLQVFLNEGDGSFGPPSEYTTFAPYAFSLRLGDTNGDGSLDIAAATLGSGSYTAGMSLDSLTLLVNDGTGAFAPRNLQNVGRGPRSVEIADLDRDGAADIAVASAHGDSICVLRGLGDGEFETLQTEPVGWRPSDVIAADLDLDGRVDLATTNEWEDTLSILLNQGDGDFVGINVQSGGYGPRALVAAELTGDGRRDLAVLNSLDHSLCLLWNDPGGVFSPLQIYDVQASNDYLFAADFDLDGDHDLLCAGFFQFTLLLNDGKANFHESVTVEHPQFGAENVVVGHLNGDGFADLMLLSSDEYRPTEIVTYLNNGDGTFAEPRVLQGPEHCTDLTLGDVDGDGTEDCVTSSFFEQAIYIYQNDGEGTFGEPVLIDLPMGWVPTRTMLSDLDGDGDSDLVCVYRTGRLLDVFFTTVLLQEGDMLFEVSAHYYTGRIESAIATSDLDNDGQQDLVVVNRYSNTVSLLYNRCTDPCIGDVDGDGDTDQSDLGLLLVSYEKPPGDPFFDPRADLDGDGEVGQADLGVLLADYACSD